MDKISKIESAKELNVHLDELSNLIGRAFFNDPYYIHIMPDNQKRAPQIKWWAKILLKYTKKNGSIYVTHDYKGVAMWLGPDKPTLDDLQLALLGLILYPFKVGFKNFMRLLNISEQ